MHKKTANNDVAGDVEPVLMTYRQAARVLQVSDRTVWALVNKNRALPAVRVGGSVRIDRRDLLAFIDGQKNKP